MTDFFPKMAYRYQDFAGILRWKNSCWLGGPAYNLVGFGTRFIEIIHWFGLAIIPLNNSLCRLWKFGLS
jgi:hypothetical protein